MDVCLRALGSVRGYAPLVSLNGLTFGQAVAPGLELELPEGNFVPESIVRPRRSPGAPLFAYYEVRPQQTLADVCLQLYGGIDQYAQLIADNNLAFGQALVPGTVLAYRLRLNRASEHVRIYDRDGRVIATAGQYVLGDFSTADFGFEYLLSYRLS